MKTGIWRWLLGMALAATVCMGARAQDGRSHHRHDRGSKDRSHDQRVGKQDFAQRVYRITLADSTQKLKMKPAVDRTQKRLEALRLSYQKQEKRVLDSLSLQLKPVLKEEQLKRLSDWRERTSRK